MIVAALLASLEVAHAVPPLPVGTQASDDDAGDGHIGVTTSDGLLPVTGGSEVPDKLKWPDAAGVVIHGYVSCTGTLIAPDLVITAGHCTTGANPEAVILGTNDGRDPGERIDVERTWTYPNSQSSGYDVAVMKLERPSSYPPRIIANDCVKDDIYTGAEVQIVGYGATDSWGNRYTNHLMEATSVITDAECTGEAGHYGCNRNISPGGEIGAGGDGVDSCFGDSGGPLYLPTARGTFLIGVTSRGWSDVSVPCGYGGIWVRPDAPPLFEWLEEVTGETLARPSCMDPTAPALYFVKNHDGSTVVDPRDPNGPFEFSITVPPRGGDATVDDTGEVRFSPNRGFEGETSVRVHVVNADGGSGDIDVPILSVSRGVYREATGHGAGCDSLGTTGVGFAGLAGFAALLAGLGARRRK